MKFVYLGLVLVFATHALDASEPKFEPENVQPIRVGGPEWPTVEGIAREKAMALIADLGSTDPSARQEARLRLAAMGKDVRPLVVQALYHDNPLVRTECAVQLGDAGAQETIKYLVEAFYAAMPERGEAPTYQRTFVRALLGSLERLTGKRFSVVEARSPLVQATLRDYIGWYAENLDRLAPQMGEPELSPIDPQYFEKIHILRALVLEKRSWPRPPLSVETALGSDSVAPTGQPWTPVRAADEVFLDTIPTAPRVEMKSDGFFRPEDKRWAEELLRKGREELKK